MNPLRDSSDGGIQLIAFSCDHCGAPLSVPDGVQSVICAYCGAQLEVRTVSGDAECPALDSDHKISEANSKPRTPVLDYQSTAPVGWRIVATFKSVGAWHEAARVLKRAGILAQMRDDPQDASNSALAVPTPDAENALQLLARAGRGASLEAGG